MMVVTSIDVKQLNNWTTGPRSGASRLAGHRWGVRISRTSP